MKRIALYLMIVLAAAAAETPQELYQKALVKERSEGKLDEAIQLYRRAADSAGKDRALAAKALLQLGDCYEKLGSTEARRQYDRVIRDYADQKDAVAAARARIGGTGTQETGTVLRKVWGGDNADLRGRPSPDGRFLPFVDWTSGGSLAVRDLSAAENRVLAPGNGSTFAGAAIFSPGGKQIAYNWYDDKGGQSLRLIGTDGARMRVLMNDVGKAPNVYAWSPDGKQIAVNLFDYGDKTNLIGLVSPQDGSLRRLKSTGWRSPEIGGFSPDGRYLVYSVPNTLQTADGGIFVIATDGSRETPVVQGKSIDSSPVWTPDGRTIVFSSDRSGAKGLWSIQITDGIPKGSPELVRGDMGEFVNMGFSRDGSYFYGMQNRQTDTYVAGLDQETLHTTPPKRLTDRFVGSNSGIGWSPDGKWVAFLRGADRRSMTLVIRSVETGEERTLPTKLEDAYAAGRFGPNWFPDGRSLLVADVIKNRRVFRRIDIETGQERVVFEGPYEIWPLVRLSPDGKALYYSIHEKILLHLMKRNLETGQEAELYSMESPGAGFFGLSVSPDGSRLAFMANVETPHRVLMTLSTEGGTPRELYRGDYENPLPFTGAWTKDSRNVLIGAKDGSLTRLWAIPAEGGARRKLDVTMETILQPAVSPDGRSVAFTGGHPKNELWVIHNLFAEARAGR